MRDLTAGVRASGRPQPEADPVLDLPADGECGVDGHLTPALPDRGSISHDNSLEGIWTGLRNGLRTFRGVSKWYLHRYAAMFEWGYNVKRVNPEFIGALLNT